MVSDMLYVQLLSGNGTKSDKQIFTFSFIYGRQNKYSNLYTTHVTEVLSSLNGLRGPGIFYFLYFIFLKIMGKLQLWVIKNIL